MYHRCTAPQVGGASQVPGAEIVQYFVYIHSQVEQTFNITLKVNSKVRRDGVCLLVLYPCVIGTTALLLLVWGSSMESFVREIAWNLQEESRAQVEWGFVIIVEVLVVACNQPCKRAMHLSIV